MSSSPRRPVVLPGLCQRLSARKARLGGPVARGVSNPRNLDSALVPVHYYRHWDECVPPSPPRFFPDRGSEPLLERLW